MCVATSGVKGIYKIAHFSKYISWSHYSASDLQSGYSWFGCSEVFTLVLQPLEEGQATGERQQECEILPCAGTAWKWMSFILSFENWIPWVVIESAVRPMGLSSSAWIFLSSQTREIKEALDHSLPVLDGDSSKQERKHDWCESFQQGGVIAEAWLSHDKYLCSD